MSREAVLNNYDAQMAAAGEMRRAKAAGSDSPLVKGGVGGLSSPLTKGDRGINDSGQSGSFRERVMATRRAKEGEEGLGDETEAGGKSVGLSGLVEGKLEDKLLNLIPGYGPWLAFKKAVTGRGKKLDLVSIIIMLFSNIEALLIVLGVLAVLSLIITWATNPLKALEDIWNMGWNTFVPALVNLFKDLL